MTHTLRTRALRLSPQGALLAADWRKRGSSKQAFALGRRQDPEHLAVFRDRAARNLDALVLLEYLDDGLVADGVGLVLLIDQSLDRLLHALARDVLVGDATNARVEEILELEQALRRVHVLVGGHTRN